MEEPDNLVVATEDALSHLVIEGSTSACITQPILLEAEKVLKLIKQTEANAVGNEDKSLSQDGTRDVTEDRDGIASEYVNGDSVKEGDGGTLKDENGDAAEDGNGDEDAAEEGDAEGSSLEEEGSEDEETDPDDDSALTENEENLRNEVHFTEEDIQKLLEDFVQAEEEAAEAQENLEDESLERTREDVFEELSEKLSGAELEAAVTEEMTTYMEIWEERLAMLEDHISLLQEKLEDAGENLPELYRWLEKQVPERCTTEAWRKRTHWAGLVPTPEAFEVVKMAEKELTAERPVRRHHGRLQDEGASGFLVKKVNSKVEADLVKPSEDGWALVDFLDREEENPGPGQLMGTEKWASVYLASTPEQAAQMGLSLPGVDTVEEIGDMDSDKSKLFKEALANEGATGFTGQQNILLKKVREEDDVKKSQKLRKRMVPPRARKPRTPYVRRKPDLPEAKNGLEASCSGATRGDPDLSLRVVLPIEGGELPPLEEKSRIGEGASSLEPELDEKFKVERLKAETVDMAVHANGEISQIDDDVTGKPEKESSGPWIIDCAGVVYLDGANNSEAKYSPNSEDDTASVKHLKRRLTPTEIEPESSDAKRLKTTVVIDSDGEHEEIEECTRQERLLRDRKRLGGAGGKSSKDMAEVVVLGSRKNTSQQVQLEKSRSGQWHSSSPQCDDEHSEEGPLKPQKKKRAGLIKLHQDTEPREFLCTACGMLLKNREVLRHPQLDVGICRVCKNFLFSGPFHKDKDGHEDECRWCGQGGDVLCCESCDKVFCCSCIKRNFGQRFLDLIVNSEDWNCFLCNKEPLHPLCQQYKAVKEAMKVQMLEESEEEFPTEKDDGKPRKRKGRRNIRRVLDDRELDEKTKNLLALEKERQERLESWRVNARANGSGTPIKPSRSNRQAHIDEELLDMDDDDIATEGFVLNKARQEDEEPVRIAPHICGFLRPHQLAGLRFMWENCIESVSKVKSGADGLGCILAHSMGLGKTLQVIAFIHTVLKKVDLGLRTVLIVVPVNVLHNWRSEFYKWQPHDEKMIPVYMLEDVARDNVSRAKLLSRWQKLGGVMLIGYTAFRNLSMGKTVKEKPVREDLCVSLQQPGPDILVCDEAHMIKNRKADITQALRQVRTHRRIALTGSPLQNNLMEYFCMVDFVREGFLGPAPSFKRRFQNPIENGQRADSTLKDVKIMKHRAHVLHKQLKGFVQRKTMSVLKDELPSKCVYVISVRLSPVQRALYLRFLGVSGFLKNGTMEKQSGGSFLFEAYHTLAKIWNHPDLLLLAQEEKDMRKEDDVENFIVDIDDDVPDVVEIPNGTSSGTVIVLDDSNTGVDESLKVCMEGKNKCSNGIHTLNRTNGENEDLDKAGWWKDMMEGQPREVMDLSGKMVILLKILSLSSARGDKALVFSQSLHTLDLIETFLEYTPCLHGYKGNWRKRRDWYRLDGQTSAKARQELVERFNDPDNTSVQCVLISTRAGSLGINLPAANRVIIFDGSWNPTHDLQALFRAWRFGQKKPVYAYRLLASGTMEEKIYNRQVAKEGLAARVLDEHQVGRYFVEDDLDFLFVLDNDEDSFQFEDTEGSISKKLEAPSCHTSEVTTTEETLVQKPGKLKRMAFSIPDDAPPRDDVMGKLLLEYRPKWIVRYHEHEPLLEDLEDEKLSKEEQTLAWESFQHEGSEWRPASQSTPGASHSLSHSSGPQPIYFNATNYTPPLYPITTQGSSQVNPVASQNAVPCTTESHVRQLQTKGIRAGSNTRCGICNEIIAWETIRRS